MKRDMMLEFLMEGTVSFPKLLFMHYTKLNINETELMLFINLHLFIESGKAFPTPAELADNMTISAEQASTTLRKFMKQGLLLINESVTDSNIRYESYSLKPLWEQLLYRLEDAQLEQQQEDATNQSLNLYTMFENEFGRPLSPIECETLMIWTDQDGHSEVLIKAALREAVISGKMNFRYIDRILFEWKKNKIETVDQAKKHSENFRKASTRQVAVQSPGDNSDRQVPFYNWLEQ